MSIMHFQYGANGPCVRDTADDRFQRDPLEDLKDGLDLIFELKESLERMHPVATDTLIRLLTF
jgi:hypothetical protein